MIMDRVGKKEKISILTSQNGDQLKRVMDRVGLRSMLLQTADIKVGANPASPTDDGKLLRQR